MYLNLSITNFLCKHDIWKKYTSFYKKLSENKNLEIETFYSNEYLFRFEFKFAPRGEDHAGAMFLVNIFGWEIEIRIYDSRHWDYKNESWK